MSFWDVVAPVYDAFEVLNKAYRRMIDKVLELTPHEANVLELACGTGNISLAIAGKVNTILCTDISDNMLKVALRKAKRRKIKNISFENSSIFDTGKKDQSFDVVIASQIIHLISQPHTACEEIKRVTKRIAILAIPLLKEGTFFGKFLISIYRLFGFAPKQTFDRISCAAFLEKIGFENCECHIIKGRIPLYVAIWRR